MVLLWTSLYYFICMYIYRKRLPHLYILVRTLHLTLGCLYHHGHCHQKDLVVTGSTNLQISVNSEVILKRSWLYPLQLWGNSEGIVAPSSSTLTSFWRDHGSTLFNSEHSEGIVAPPSSTDIILKGSWLHPLQLRWFWWDHGSILFNWGDSEVMVTPRPPSLTSARFSGFGGPFLLWGGWLFSQCSLIISCQAEKTTWRMCVHCYELKMF